MWRMSVTEATDLNGIEVRTSPVALESLVYRECQDSMQVRLGSDSM